MTNPLKIRKVSVLPETLEASTMYLVQSGQAGLMEVHVSSADGLTARHTPTNLEIQQMISSALNGFSTATIVADIAALNAMAPTTIVQAIVLDATDDPTVQSGSATYIYDPNTTNWIKISESESMDVVLQWANIQGKPESLVADIDDAVVKKHSHANKAVLDDLSDVEGALAYKGEPVRAYLEEEAW